ncbi:MAG: trypsin-like peptidase domain-containing protein [Bdellovibrionaceae bacterium]|nr:trypsin-like peptidase domain-containing protein [Pseudobdellovibrionaceae bacterium]
MKFVFTLATLLLTLSIAFSAKAVIYGADDRKEVVQMNSPMWSSIADSTVVILPGTSLIRAGNIFNFVDEIYGRFYSLCKDEPFLNQPSVGQCSGSLIGENLILTAGHCFQSTQDCQDSKFIFNYAVSKSGTSPKGASASEIYSCKRVVSQVFDKNALDYAIIELDRPVVGHKPLRLPAAATDVRTNLNVTIVGNPAGLPTKVIPNGIVREVRELSFRASLDSFGGASGAPVFNTENGDLLGIISLGAQDFQTDPSRGCQETYKCDQDGCMGEKIIRIEEILKNH